MPKRKKAEEAPRYQIGPRTIELVMPVSVAVRYDVLGAETSNHRKVSAALGVCSHYLARWMRKRNVRYTGDAGAYGAAVFDALIAEGASAAQIFEAGHAALALIGRDLPGLTVEEDAGNSGAGED